MESVFVYAKSLFFRMFIKERIKGLDFEIQFTGNNATLCKALTQDYPRHSKTRRH